MPPDDPTLVQASEKTDKGNVQRDKNPDINRNFQRDLASIRRVFVATALISVAVNILMLSSPLYMLQVFDRVLSGRSVETLLFLSVIVLFALAVLGAMDACRALVLARLGDWLERRLGHGILSAAIDHSATPGSRGSHQPVKDLTSVRQFLSSPGVGALFDAPWIPIFLVVIWLLHPVLGVVAFGSAVVLAALTLATELLTRRHTQSAAQIGAVNDGIMQAAIANADTLQTMGLAKGVEQKWAAGNRQQSHLLLRVASRLGILSVSSKAIRLTVQSAILGAGAYLVLQRVLSPGQMIAGSILLSRALAPVEVAIGSWRQFVSSRQAWHRLQSLLAWHAAQPRGAALPEPAGALTSDKADLRIPGLKNPILSNIDFALEPGEHLGIIGASASGKTCLGRLISGAWSPSNGVVRLDGAELKQWDRSLLGSHIGYLPQRVELFSGTVAENIARFQDFELEDVVAAAELAGAEQMIRALPLGYETDVGARGDWLSGGQRQRVALARAVFGNPKLVVLDEPDANLDQIGQTGLVRCINTLKSRGVTTVTIAHRRAILDLCDKLLLIQNGKVAAFGERERVIQGIAAAQPISLHPSDDGTEKA